MGSVKDAAWASAITGIPASRITTLAEMYAKGGATYSEYSYGLQRQAEGVTNLWALQCLGIITKRWGKNGEGYGRGTGVSRTGNGFAFNHNLLDDSYKYASCTIWHDLIRFAFADAAKNNGYTAKYIPGFSPANGKSFIDDSGVKSAIRHVEITNTAAETLGYIGNRRFETVVSAGKTYYKVASTTPVGARFILNIAGNTLINQHQNSNDSADLLSCIPVSGSADDPDTLCVVSLDNFLSPSARWSDYVLPGAMNWEMPEILVDNPHTAGTYLPKAIEPPGEAMETWTFLSKWLKAIEGYDSVLKAKNAHDFYMTDEVSNGGDGQVKTDVNEWIRKRVATASAQAGNLHNGENFDTMKVNGSYKLKVKGSMGAAPGKDLWDGYAAADKTQKFIVPGDANKRITTHDSNSITSVYSNGSPNNKFAFCKENIAVAPNPSYRFHVYSDILVWEFEHRFETFHLHLPANQRGGINKWKFDDDIKVYPIPLYIHYLDYFNDAYNKNLPTNPILVTSTHMKFRSHSSHNENPLLRELSKRTKTGKPANDWQSYGVMPEDPGAGNMASTTRLGADFKDDEYGYELFWMNPEDAKARNIKDGDIVIAENPIGKVRVSAKVSHRISKGMAVLYQGAWYDPNPADGVDDGGNVNTLMASEPSRIDHGNAQMSAMVSVRKA